MLDASRASVTAQSTCSSSPARPARCSSAVASPDQLAIGAVKADSASRLFPVSDIDDDGQDR